MASFSEKSFFDFFTSKMYIDVDLLIDSDKFKMEDCSRKYFFNLLQSGTFVDVDFLVGPDKLKIPAHKIILSSASDVFAAKLCNPNWHDGDKLELPEELGETSVRYFMKFIYTGELGPELGDMEFSVLLELIKLADIFLIPNLITSCLNAVKKRIGSQICLEIYEETKVYATASKISELAFKYIKENLEKILEERDPSEWSFDCLQELLSQNYLQIEEIKLFRHLLKWRKVCDPQAEHFKTLLCLIRFKLMDAQQFLDEVVTSDALEKDLVNDLLKHFNETTKQIYIEERRQLQIAHNYADLQQLINSSKPGDIIELLEQEYKGFLRIPNDKIYLSIRGQGEKSILSGTERFGYKYNMLEINAENFYLTSRCLKIGSTGSISVNSSNGIYKNLSIKFNSFEREDCPFGMQLKGDENLLENIKLVDLNQGIVKNENEYEYITKLFKCVDAADYNEIRNIEPCFGIDLTIIGSRCELKNIFFGSALSGVFVQGSFHILNDIKSEFLMITANNSNFTNVHSTLTYIKLYNNIFKNVDFGKLHFGRKCERHQFDNCKAESVFAKHKVMDCTLEGCNFEIPN